jgi:putative ABC transport system substrate-binding protein
MALRTRKTGRLWNRALCALSTLLLSLTIAGQPCADNETTATSETAAGTQKNIAAGKRIAAIMSSDQPRYHGAHRSFITSLAARGYPPSSTEIILHTPTPDQPSWSSTIRTCKTYKPDLIVAYGASAALTAMKESGGIPVVSADVYAGELQAKGLYGVHSRVPMITLLKTLQEIHPYRRIGIIYTSRESGSQSQRDEIRKLALQLVVSVTEVNTLSASTLENGLNSLIDRSDVIIATESSIVCRNFDRIISRTREHNIPVAATMPDSAEKGALVSLEIDPQEQGHLAADIAVRLLEGATPDHLTLLNPRRIDLVVNMRTAREMGLKLPFQVLGNATRVIK